MTAPTVLISGAGVAGLFLAILLDRANIPYHIYEKAPHVVPIGASLGINCSILPAFEQLGLLEDLKRISLPCKSIDLYDENLKLLGLFDLSMLESRAGYWTYIFHRPDLYDILLSRVPADKISFNKKIVSYEQDQDGVTIHTSDNETHRGDILVGADGTYSTVRKIMLGRLEKSDQLDAADKRGLKATHACVVGTTNPMDPEKFPVLKDGYTHFSNIVGHAKAHTWMIATLPNNRISYIIEEQLDSKEGRDIDALRSKWLTPEGKERIIKATQNLPIKHDFPTGLTASPEDQRTLGDLIENTDPDKVSTILLEEQLVKTWHDGRTVLMGDACHKMNPSTGQGAVNALLDAVVLVNCLYELSGDDQKGPLTLKQISEAFRDYREQRFQHAKFQLENAGMIARSMNGQTWVDKIIRVLVTNTPVWVLRKLILSKAGYRPQVSFLPRIADPPNLNMFPQKPSKRYMQESQQHAEK
ncbi:hypothetical protein B0O80DRAFT_504630 [Mortierella sp. GBAus27b]|nr:hypothetical protein BGX31_010185 [Mortierella sp. GBA43]KAI8345108.1 hypothetical protein B0O80DRAFT_504630 [Mortierella sp. GBAus27b]